MKRTFIRLVLVAAAVTGAVAGLAGCAAAPSGPAVEGAEPGAYALWPTEIVEFPDIPLVERTARLNNCFQPEGTYAICSAEFEYSDANVDELIGLFTDAGFTGGEPSDGGGGILHWNLSKGEITVSISASEAESYLSLDLSDRS